MRAVIPLLMLSTLSIACSPRPPTSDSGIAGDGGVDAGTREDAGSDAGVDAGTPADAGDLLPDGGCRPSTETCDGLDNDCDGQIDDGLNSCELCADTYHELPVVTHWSGSLNRISYLGTDQAPVMQPFPGGTYLPGTCVQTFAQGRMPDLDQYVGDIWSVTAIENTEAKSFFTQRCTATQVAMRLLRPDALGTTRLRSRSGAVQILHANVVDGSLLTVILPGNWAAKATAGTYPVVITAQSDLNENLFHENGAQLIDMIALSGTTGRTGAIGVIWNGGGAYGGQTTTLRSLEQFANVVDFLATNFSADRHRLLMFGEGRGATAALVMASNPTHADYQVTYVAAAAPSTRQGEQAQLLSMTFPTMLRQATWTLGLADAWRTGWVYPACAGKAALTGKAAPLAMLYVTVGVDDFSVADNIASLVSPSIVTALKEAQTKVYLQMGSHSAVAPYAHQLEFGTKLLAAGVPLETEILVRAGQASRSESGATFPNTTASRIWEALQTYVDPPQVGRPLPLTPQVRFYRVNRGTGQLDAFTLSDGHFPFNMECPRIAAVGQRFPVILTGAAGTNWELTLRPPAGAPWVWTGTIGTDLKSIQWVELIGGSAVGDYGWGLRIQKPGSPTWVAIPSSFTIDGSPAVLSVYPDEPNVSGEQIMNAVRAPSVPNFPATGWGLSEY